MAFDSRLIDLAEPDQFWPLVSNRFQHNEVWLDGLNWAEPKDADLYRLQLELKESRVEAAETDDSFGSLFEMKRSFGFAELIPTTNILLFVQALLQLNMQIPDVLKKKLNEANLTETQLKEISEWRGDDDVRSILREALRLRLFTPKFLYAWERYHAAVKNLEFYIQWLAPQEYEAAHGQATLDGLQAWSSLIRADIATHAPGLLQKQIDAPFEDFLNDIVAGRLNAPSYINPNWMRKWVGNALKTEAVNAKRKLRRAYTSEKISVSENRLKSLESLKQYLPPYHVNEYS